MWEIQIHKKGKRLYGGFYINKEKGLRIYLAYRWHRQIFRSDENSTSEAMRKGVACWAFDCDTLQLAKIQGVQFVGVKLKDDGSLFLAPIEAFYDPENIKILNYSSKGGSHQRFLPLSKFRTLTKMKL